MSGTLSIWQRFQKMKVKEKILQSTPWEIHWREFTRWLLMEKRWGALTFIRQCVFCLFLCSVCQFSFSRKDCGPCSLTMSCVSSEVSIIRSPYKSLNSFWERSAKQQWSIVSKEFGRVRDFLGLVLVLLLKYDYCHQICNWIESNNKPIAYI